MRTFRRWLGVFLLVVPLLPNLGTAQGVDHVTANGWITGSLLGGHATLAVDASGPAAPTGYLDFDDGRLLVHTHIVSTAITGYTIVSPTVRRLTGPCTLNGLGGFSFTAVLSDLANPGAGHDTFSITLSSLYSTGGTLAGGDIHIYPAGGGTTVPVLVQQAANSGTGLTVLTVSMSQLPVTGNVLVVSHDSTSGSNSSVSGGGVDSWTLCQSSLPTAHNSEIWAGVVGSSPNTTITITLGGTNNSAGAIVTEFSGLRTPLVFEGSATNGSGGTTSAPATTGSVTVNANDVVVATVGAHSTNNTISTPPANGFTDLVRAAPQQSHVMAAAYRIAPAAGTASTSWTLQYNTHWATAIVAFRAP
jgi:hypothetical protein